MWPACRLRKNLSSKCACRLTPTEEILHAGAQHCTLDRSGRGFRGDVGFNRRDFHTPRPQSWHFGRTCRREASLRPRSLAGHFSLGQRVGSPPVNATISRCRMSRVRLRANSSAVPSAAIANGDWLWLQSLDMNLTGSAVTGLRAGNGTSTNGGGSRNLSLSFDRLGLIASPFNCLDSAVHVELAADDVRLSAKDDGAARSFSIDLKDGRLILEIDRKDLEKLVRALVNEALRSEGIEITAVELEFEPLGSRALKIRSRLTAKRRIVSATLEGAGVLVVDAALNARLKDFQLRGDGVVASLVARLVRPQLEKLASQEVSLRVAVLGSLSLTEIEFQASEKLRIAARFESNREGHLR